MKFETISAVATQLMSFCLPFWQRSWTMVASAAGGVTVPNEGKPMPLAGVKMSVRSWKIFA